MKIRSTFVSNSSSSSFLVALKENITFDELKKLMFPDKDGQDVGAVSPWDSDEFVSVNNVVEAVHEQLRDELDGEFEYQVQNVLESLGKDPDGEPSQEDKIIAFFNSIVSDDMWCYEMRLESIKRRSHYHFMDEPGRYLNHEMKEFASKKAEANIEMQLKDISYTERQDILAERGLGDAIENELCLNQAKELAKKYIEAHPNLKYHVLVFSDDTCKGSTLEHSGILENTLNALPKSNH
jgi:hypothetical protein